MVKVIITGGHITPAIAVIEEIKKRKLPWEIIFVGRKKALEGSSVDSEEYRLIKAAGIKFLPLSSGRLQRSLTLAGLMSLIKIPWGFIQALGIVSSERPDLILTFGGYLALPVALAGRLAKISVVTHEQTKSLGLANRIISLISLKVFVSNQRALADLPPEKGIFTGLPVREGLFRPSEKSSFEYDGRSPIIYVTGGATGAQSVNEIIFPIITDLIKNFTVVHQTGGASLIKALEIRRSLGESLGKKYIVAKYFDTEDTAWIYSKAILVIGRSGANTVNEIALLGKAAILIPLPWSAGGEQEQNALTLEKAGSAIVLEQNKTNSELLLKTIKEIYSKIKIYQSYAASFAKIQIRDGAARVVNELITILK